MKFVNARELRDPKALPKELRNIADRYIAFAEGKDILHHAADELERLQEGVEVDK